MLRLIGFLAMLSIGGSGLLALDYSMLRQQAIAEDGDSPTVGEYLGGLSGRIASFVSSSATPGLPTALEDMLPKPPEGWTVRPALGEDVTVFLPRNRGDGEPKARDLIRNVVTARVSGAAEVVILTYERGERRVIVKAVRYPDDVFTSPKAMQRRFDLQMTGAEYRGLPVMTVRGLDVTEEMLPDGMRGRLFLADVGGQIHLRVLTPRRMTDAELLPFFETLHVKAMNAVVVDKSAGLGDIPVIVLASELGRADRDAYDADRAARAANKAARAREARAAAEAAVAAGAAPGAPSQPRAAECEEGAGGVKRCKVGD